MIENCKYAKEKFGIDFLVCEKQMDINKRYETTEECINVICGYQYFCRTEHKWLNTKEYNACKYNIGE